MRGRFNITISNIKDNNLENNGQIPTLEYI